MTYALSDDDELARIAHRRGDERLTANDRFISLAAGGALAFVASRMRGPAQVLTGTLGAALLARAAAGVDPLQRVVGPRPQERDLARAKGWNSAAVVSRTVTVARPARELYHFWRDFRNLARITDAVESVEMRGEDRAQMTVKGPLGSRVTWTTRVTEDVPGRRIAWETEPGADVRNAGSVTFDELPHGRGTKVRALIVYDPPGGMAGRLLAKVLRREPAIQARQELRRFKQLMEAGSVSRSIAGTSG